MNKRIILVIFSLATRLSGCTQAFSVTPSISPANTPSTTPSSGIEGQVTLGPMCPGPVAIGDTSCQDQPYQATITISGVNNQEVGRFQTDAAGYFKITLAPGTYTLHPESEKVLPRASDQTVVVMPNKYTQVTVLYDTGMR